MNRHGIGLLYRSDEPSEIAISGWVEILKTDPYWSHLETATQIRDTAKSLAQTMRVLRGGQGQQP